MVRRVVSCLVGALVLVCVVTAVMPAGAAAVPATAITSARAHSAEHRADLLLRLGQAAQRAHRFARADALYRQARAMYLAAGDAAGVRASLDGIHNLGYIAAMYPYTRAEMRELLALWYPEIAAAQREAWLSLRSTETFRYDGAMHYYLNVPINLAFRDPALFAGFPALVAGYRETYGRLVPYLAQAAALDPSRVYGDPVRYRFRQEIAVPRGELAADDLLQVWLPLPLEGGPQTDVRLSDMTPTPYMPYAPTIAGEIADLYLRVPLQTLTTDLTFGVTMSFEHALQSFKVDPQRVGRYDRRSALYRTYTRSYGNTLITPAIRRTARKVVGAERNPYLAARLLYRHILAEVKYSFVPHLALWPRGEAESAYVERTRCGDCGAQSLYFAALCRALGIPARATGGFHLIAAAPSPHFWAEFYLPAHGWVPVDTTMATLVDYLPDVPPADAGAFRDFFFANQDDRRWTVQKDEDLPFVPAADGRVYAPMVLQYPQSLYDRSVADPNTPVILHWTCEQS